MNVVTRTAAASIAAAIVAAVAATPAHTAAPSPSSSVTAPGVAKPATAESFVALAERAALRRPDRPHAIGLELALEPLAEPPAAAPARFAAPLEISVRRSLPDTMPRHLTGGDLHWEPVDGGAVALFSVASPEALALRLAIAFEALPAGAEMRYYPPDRPVEAIGPFEASFLLGRGAEETTGRPRVHWSPIVEGSALAVEIFVPESAAAEPLALELVEVSHHYRPLDGRAELLPGESGACQRDTACVGPWKEASRAVAIYVIEKRRGGVVCTGQLVSPVGGTDFKTFVTAAHCVRSQAEADSATFYWFFERPGCGTGAPAPIQTAGGAELAFSTRSVDRGDVSVLRLRREPPPGVTAQGFSTAAGLVGTRRGATVHHPGGDYKKTSLLKRIRAEFLVLPNGSVRPGPPSTHYESVWRRGTTEPGSSGASLMIGTTWPHQYAIGVLTGGVSDCAYPRGPDFHGSFKYVADNFPRFRELLGF